MTELTLLGGFSARETAASTFSAVRAAPRGRPLGGRQRDVNAALTAAWRLTARRIEEARNTPRMLANEPSDGELDRMELVVQAELDRLGAAQV